MIIKIIINEITNLKGYKMNKDKKIQGIIEELECGENTARRILSISKELDTEDYSYCDNVLEVIEELNKNDYESEYCEKILNISREHNMSYTMAHIINTISEDTSNDNYDICYEIYRISQALGTDDYPYCEEVYKISNDNGLTLEEAESVLNINQQLDNGDIEVSIKIVNILKKYEMSLEDALNIANGSEEFEMSLEESTDKYLTKKIKELYGESKVNFIKEVMEKESFHLENTNAIKSFLKISEELDTEDVDYISSIDNYMRNNFGITNITNAEKLYKEEQEQN